MLVGENSVPWQVTLSSDKFRRFLVSSISNQYKSHVSVCVGFRKNDNILGGVGVFLHIIYQLRQSDRVTEHSQFHTHICEWRQMYVPVS